MSDALLDAWSDSQIKEWCDKNGIKVPQGSKRNELIALARRNWAKVHGDDYASSASSYYGAATSNANNQFAKASDDASLYASKLYAGALGYVDWLKGQLGLAASDVSGSAAAASQSASKSASSVSKSLSKSLSSATSRAKEEL